jgi:5'-nucleotidase
MQSTFIVLIILSFMFSSCTFRKGGARNEVLKGHYQLYSHPEEDDSYLEEQNIKKIVIIGTNNLYGNVNPQYENAYSQQQNKEIQVPVGGLSYFSSYMSILRDRYPGQILLVDAGDIFQGTLISNSFQGEPVTKLYEHLQYDALTFGDNEFNIPVIKKGKKRRRKSITAMTYLKDIVEKSKTPYVTSNIYEISTGKTLGWDNVHPYIIKEVNGVKVAILAVTTKDTLSKNIKESLTGLYFEEPSKAIIKHAHLARKEGAEVIVLMAHAGLNCGERIAETKGLPLQKVNFVPEDSTSCDSKSELYKILNEMPPGIVDAIVTGQSFNKVANFIKGVPVIQNFGLGKYFSRLELYFDNNKKEVLKEKIVIHQPTKICHFFFKESEDCYTQDKTVSHDQTISAKFLGRKIEMDIVAEKLLEPYQLKVNKLANKKIVDLNKAFPHSQQSYSPFGSYVVDIIRKKLKADVGILNSSSVRFGLEKGELTYGKLFRSLPYENYLMRVKIKGKDLRELVTIGTGVNSSNQAYFSGINVVISNKKEKESDMNLEEPWKKEKEIQIFMEDGSPLKDGKVYNLATTNFLGSTAEDSFGKILNKVHHTKKKLYDRNYRDIIADEITETSVFEKVINRYVNSARVIFEN